MSATATCGQCGTTVPYGDILFTPVGSYCRPCHLAENKDSAELERKLIRSIGMRQLIIGIVMVVIGAVILAVGLSGGSLILIPTGMLVGGLVELALGISKLSSS